MNKEEIIDNLKYQNKKHYGAQSRTLIEAIKLIEQQPSEDCVSRKFMYELGATCIATRDKNGKLIALGTIENLPPVTPTFPKGATNGDMIKAMFPYIKIHEHEKTDICDAHIQIDIWDFSTYVSKDWWDAPYEE